MKVEQLYTGCLAQGAYYIESNGEVAIIDPLREVTTYTDMAAKRNASIKYIFETHFHADFVSGHVTLAEQTGAKIVYGPTATTEFDSLVATDNQEFKLGNVTIRVLHTPGHTMESTSYLLIDENGKEHAVFSGDTLFLGDVGRPDLSQKAATMTQEELAGTLFDSLRSKIMTLPDDTIVYPGHGAGSACGKNMSKETVGSIGDQKENNYALRADMTKAEFVEEVTDGLLPPPAYFPMNVMLNKTGYKDVAEVIKQGQNALAPEKFELAVNESGALVLDVRSQHDFYTGHIPRSIFIGIDGNFAPWVGSLIKDIAQPILLVCDPERLEEVIIRLSRVGFDNVLGYLEGGFEAWNSEGKEVDTLKSITTDEFASIRNAQTIHVVDVRKDTEYSSEHVLDAVNAPLADLNLNLDKFNEDEDNYIHCAGGYRSMIASSILKSRGIHNIIEVQGGFTMIKETTVPTSTFVCPTEL
ncbi:MAG: hydroxyacylglutathione hydrolase [Flavobacteriaceae bacterium]|jgi:hydroxyacylglutathione hydrolase